MSVLITFRIAGLATVSVEHLTKLWNATVLMGCVEILFRNATGFRFISNCSVSWMSLVILSSERENKVEVGTSLETPLLEGFPASVGGITSEA